MTQSRFCMGALAMVSLLLVPAIGRAQLTGSDNGEWRPVAFFNEDRKLGD